VCRFRILDGIAVLAPLGQKWGGDTAYIACKVVALVASEDWAELSRIQPGLDLLVGRLREEIDDVWALAIVATAKLAQQPASLEALLDRGLADAIGGLCEACPDTCVPFPQSPQQQPHVLSADSCSRFFPDPSFSLGRRLRKYASSTALKCAMHSVEARQALLPKASSLAKLSAECGDELVVYYTGKREWETLPHPPPVGLSLARP